jgi:hypothetical protein
MAPSHWPWWCLRITIISAYNEGFNGALRPVIVDTQVTVFDVTNQLGSLIQAISEGFAPRSFRVNLSGRLIQPGQARSLTL